MALSGPELQQAVLAHSAGMQSCDLIKGVLVAGLVSHTACLLWLAGRFLSNGVGLFGSFRKSRRCASCMNSTGGQIRA
jgi:hypothetical protein